MYTYIDPIDSLVDSSIVSSLLIFSQKKFKLKQKWQNVSTYKFYKRKLKMYEKINKFYNKQYNNNNFTHKKHHHIHN